MTRDDSEGEIGDEQLEACMRAAFARASERDRVTEACLVAGAERGQAGDSRYVIVGELGRGGLGIVHRGHDQSLERDVAIKELRAELARDAGARQRFLEEAQIAAQLQHPSIVPVYDVGTFASAFGDGRAHDGPFFTMKLIEGRTLEEALRARSAGDAEHGLDLFEVFARVCEATAYAHTRGVVHRDLKPANVMLGAYGEVLVVDWGIAKVMRDEAVAPVQTIRSRDESAHSTAGTVFGTWAYMPPEQAKGAVAAVDARVDVFALGAVLCEVLTGAPPYRGSAAERRRQAEEAALQDARERLRKSQPEVLAALARACLEPDVEQRPKDAAAVADAMRAYFRGVEDELARARVQAATGRLRVRALSLLLLLAAVASVFIWRARSEASENLRRYELLSWPVLLEDLRATQEASWPPWQDARAALAQWCTQARTVVASRSEVEAAVLELRREAEAWSEEERQRDEKKRLEELEAAEFAASMFEETSQYYARKRALFVEEDAWREARARARAAVAAIEARRGQRQSWSFASRDRRFLHDALVEFSEELDDFEARLEFTERALADAPQIEERSLGAREAQKRWRDARARIAASPRYASLEIAPQMGLVPLRENPRSGLWEFVHLASGARGAEAPRVSKDGRLELDEASGILFVLVPGGRSVVGSQKRSPSAKRYDRDHMSQERPFSRTRLDPYFLAAHELTLAQWRRLAGRAVGRGLEAGTRSDGVAEPIDDVHPVTSVTWGQAVDTLRRWGLELPSEHQWEYACRAGTHTPWYSGAEPSSLEGFENICDLRYGPVQGWTPTWDDGHYVHARVASYRPNPWGFYDMLGNVEEWCLDLVGFYTTRAREGDGVFEAGSATTRIVRGGSFHSAPSQARCAHRSQGSEESYEVSRGVRPVRLLRPARNAK